MVGCHIDTYDNGARVMVIDWREEQARVIGSFSYWLERWAHIEDKPSHSAIRFEAYPCQSSLIPRIEAGEWLRILKARQLGITWLYALYTYWRCAYHEMWGVAYIVHKTKFAHNFINRLKLIHENLPEALRGRMTTDSKGEIMFNHRGQGSWVRALAATAGAADSMTGDLVIIDEATKIEALRPGLLSNIIQSVGPVVEKAGGAVVLIGTSEGASGTFWTGWKASESGKSKFRNVFFPWSAEPNRDVAWYEREKGEHEEDPLYMPRQYPATPEEAFSHATGRIYPAFSHTTHVVRYQRPVSSTGELGGTWGQLASDLAPGSVPYIDDSWDKWRAIDFGGVDPFVCLWIARIPGDKTSLTVDPSCENFIREMCSYRRRPDSDFILDRDNHGPDAFRYAVCTFHLTGHIHIYREMYIPRSAAMGFDLPELAVQVKQRSEGEHYRGSVADRSGTSNIVTLNKHGIKCIPHQRPYMGHDTKTHEIEQGIICCNVFVIGNSELIPIHEKPPEQKVIEEAKKMADQGVSLELGEHRRYKSAVQKYRDRLAALTPGSNRKRLGGRSRRMKHVPVRRTF